jgi:iron complex transport system ATP-binding protein
MIGFRDVVVRYAGQPEPALGGVTFCAERGRVTAVVGPNGSGKSTLVRALVRRVKLESGAIEIDGRSTLTQGQRELASRVAVVTQREEPAFPLAVREYIALGRYPRLGMFRPPAATDREAIARAISLTETEAFLSRSILELSGGEWQRVRLARAVAQGGDAIVLDEPTTFLDIGHEMALFELVSRLASENQAVLLVSHQLNLVARFAHEMILLHRGRIAAFGEPSAVMRAEILEHVYDWPVVVSRDPAIGAPALVPLRVRSRIPKS